MNRKVNLSALVIVALAGSSAGAQVIDWASAVDGNWNDAFNWSPANVPNLIGEDAVLGLVGAYTVHTINSFTIGSLTLSNPLVVLQIGSNQTLILNGDLNNSGIVNVNFQGTIFNAHLSFNTDATIAGNGSILLNAQSDPGDAQILANAFTVTNASGHLIHGSGHIAGAMINSGNIIADDPAGAGLRLGGTLTQTPGGNAGADAGTLLLGNGSITTGGELLSINGGVISVQTSATIGNIINSGDIEVPGQGWSLRMNGDVQNNGTITLNSNGAIFNAHLWFDGATTLAGSGNVMMVSAGDLGDAQILTSGLFDGTIGGNQTVEGSGLITGGSDGTIVNLGTINGNDPAVGLGLAGNHSGVGGGVYRSDGGSIILRNGLVLNGGTFDSSGTGIVEMTSSGIATLSNITNLGQMGVRGQGGSITLTGPMTNNGTLTLNSNGAIFNAHLRFGASTAIDGSGTINMATAGSSGDAQLFTDGPFIGTIGASQTVQGSGQVDGRSDGTIVNNGTINGNDPAFPLELRGNHTSSGMYRSDDGVLALINGANLDGGTFDSSGTGIVEMTSSGIVTLSNITNLGQMGVRGQGGSISLAGPMTNDGTLTINSNNNGFNAHLRFVADTAITGSGTVRMKMAGSDLGDAQLFTDGKFFGVIGANQTVAGSGIVDGRSLGTIVNDGTINGDDPVFELRLQGNHDGTGGGVYRSDDGLLGLSNGLVMNGGTFDSLGTGIVDMTTSGTVMLSNMTNFGTLGIRGQGGVVGLSGPLTNNGTILINSNDNGFNAHIRFFAATEINGTGTINMELTGSLGDAQILNDQGFIGTIGSGQTITGSGMIVGEMNMNGIFDPSSDERRFHLAGDTNLSATSGFVADLGGLLIGEFDRLTMGVGDTMNLDGTLTVNLDAGYLPEFGDSWDIISGGSVTGEFASEVVPESGIGLVYRVIYEPSRVFVVLTCAADLTGDNVLDFFDISLFLNYFTSNDVRSDLNGDGVFDFFDISLFLQIFNGDCL